MRRLDVAIRLAAESFMYGRHRSVRRGFSSEFSDYREYVPGDEVSDIDWRVFARTDKFYTKCFEAETSMRCTLAVDVSASMAYASQPRLVSKGRYAGLVAAVFAYLLHRQRDRVGLALFDERLRRLISAKSRKQHFFTLLEMLDAGIERPRQGDVASGLHELARNLTKRGMVVVLSDLLTGRSSELLSAVEHLVYRGQDVLVLQVMDPAEPGMSLSAGSVVRDPEGGSQFEVDGISLTRCREVLRSLLEGYRRRFYALGVDYALMTTDQPLDVALSAFLASRRWQRRSGRKAAGKRIRA